MTFMFGEVTKYEGSIGIIQFRADTIASFFAGRHDFFS